MTEATGLLMLAFGWPPSEIADLEFDEAIAYAEVAKVRLKRML